MMWQQGSFDVIFTDCNMPEMNGYQLAQAIRQQEEQEQRPPILLLGFTANALPDEKERCRAAGMDDCLFKPISLSGLRACLQQHMNGRDNKVAGEGDISYSLDELSFMEDEQLQQLLEHLLQGLRDDMESLQSLVLLGNAAGIARVAHQIKGAARIINASQLINSCQALEDYCRQHEDISEQHPLVQAFTRPFPRCRPYWCARWAAHGYPEPLRMVDARVVKPCENGLHSSIFRLG
jgi:two-component system sensor histidine kinase EvgS